jgi:hypothetical protein
VRLARPFQQGYQGSALHGDQRTGRNTRRCRDDREGDWPTVVGGAIAAAPLRGLPPECVVQARGEPANTASSPRPLRPGGGKPYGAGELPPTALPCQPRASNPRRRRSAAVTGGRHRIPANRHSGADQGS